MPWWPEFRGAGSGDVSPALTAYPGSSSGYALADQPEPPFILRFAVAVTCHTGWTSDLTPNGLQEAARALS